MISVCNIVKKLKPKHPWLDESSLQDYIKAVQKKLYSNKIEDAPRPYASNANSDDNNDMNNETCHNSSELNKKRPVLEDATSSNVNSKDSSKAVNQHDTIMIDKATQTDDSQVAKPYKKREQSAATKCYLQKKYGSFDSSSEDESTGPPSCKKQQNSVLSSSKSTICKLNLNNEEDSTKNSCGDDGKYTASVLYFIKKKGGAFLFFKNYNKFSDPSLPPGVCLKYKKNIFEFFKGSVSNNF